jgi:hypothetical protein
VANGVTGLVAVVVLGVGAGGCSDDDGGGNDDGGSLSQDDLAGAGSECPVDLTAAVAEAGLDADGDVTVEVTEGSGGGRQDDAAIDQVGGFYVACTQPVTDGGEITAVVFGSEQPGAVGMLLPQIAADLGLTADDVEGVFDRVQRTAVGGLADLDVEGPAAVARIDIDGAESGVLYVSSSGASPDEVRAVAEDLLARL